MPQTEVTSNNSRNFGEPSSKWLRVLYTKLDSWSRIPTLLAIHEGFLFVLPIVVIGALVTLLSEVSNLTWQRLGLVGDRADLSLFFAKLGGATSGALAIFLSASTSYALARRRARPSDDRSLPIMCAIAVPACLVLALMERDGGLQLTKFGVTSIALALFIALLFSWTTAICARWYSRYIGHSESILDALPVSAATLFAVATAMVLCFAAIEIMQAVQVAPLDAMNNIVVWIFAHIESEFLRLLLYVFLVHVLWFFGIHGQNVLIAVSRIHFETPMDANVALALAGQEAPAIATPAFLSSFVYIGGSGATLALLLAIFLQGKRAYELRRLAGVSLPMSAFMINESVIFGVPIVLNPTLLIPWLVAPLVATSIAFTAIFLGFAPTATHHVHWSTPVILNAYSATQTWGWVVLQGVVFGAVFLIYWPFVQYAASLSRRRNDVQLVSLERLVESNPDHARLLHSRGDALGRLAQHVVRSFERDLRNGKMLLHYQPKFNVRGELTGFEALTRWQHPRLGQLSMSTVSQLVEASHVSTAFTVWSIEQACAQLAGWNAQGYLTQVAVNIPPSQALNAEVVDVLQRTVARYGVSTQQLGIELTEREIVGQSDEAVKALRALRELGLAIAVDDFGMGCTSLRYLRAIHVDSIKIDASLVRDILTDKNCQDIVQAIAQYAQAQKISLCAEYVETKAQRDKLVALGCSELQGYLYAKAEDASACERWFRVANADIGSARTV
jgi:lactose/cellobiose-specific phosphotransferase system IIC component